jgi:hypothetical protein
VKKGHVTVKSACFWNLELTGRHTRLHTAETALVPSFAMQDPTSKSHWYKLRQSARWTDHFSIAESKFWKSAIVEEPTICAGEIDRAAVAHQDQTSGDRNLCAG